MNANNRASNATYLGEFIAGIIQPATEDQYRPMPATLFVEQDPEPNVPNYEPIEFSIYGVAPLEILEGEEQEAEAEELPEQDWAAQKTEYEL